MLYFFNNISSLKTFQIFQVNLFPNKKNFNHIKIMMFLKMRNIIVQAKKGCFNHTTTFDFAPQCHIKLELLQLEKGGMPTSNSLTYNSIITQSLLFFDCYKHIQQKRLNSITN